MRRHVDGRRLRLVLVAHDVNHVGGMEQSFAHLIEALHDRYDITVVSCSLAPELRGLVRWRRVVIPVRPIPLKFSLFAVVAGVLVWRERGDLVHTMGAIIPNKVDLASIHLCHAGYRAATGRLAPREAPLLRRVNTGIARTLALLAERWTYRPLRAKVLAAVSSGLAGDVETYYPGSRLVLPARRVCRPEGRGVSSTELQSPFGARNDTCPKALRHRRLCKDKLINGHPLAERVSLRVSVIVPTLRRPQALQKCLTGIEAQIHPPDEILVVCRGDDEATIQVLDTWGERVRAVAVELPGQVRALCAGVAAAQGDVVAIVDDDAVPRPDWLQRLLEHYRDPHVVAVGGRDVVHTPAGPIARSEPKVGVLTFYGRCLGNHHLGFGGPRCVDVLKGANCSYRRLVAAFPLGLRGVGAEVANDLATSLYAGRFGAVIYDSELVVDHYPDVRAAGDLRNATVIQASHASFNRALAIGTLRPCRRGARLAYALLWGERGAPGILQCVFRDHGRTAGLCRAAMAGAIAGTWTSIVRPLHMCRPADQSHFASCTAGLVKR